MRGSFDDKFIQECMERQRKLIALTFQQAQIQLEGIQQTFMDNIMRVASAPIPPPQEDDEEDSSSSSIYVSAESLSSSSDESEQGIKRYPAAVMDKWFNNEKLPPKRISRKRTFWSDANHEGEEQVASEDVGQDTPLKDDVYSFKSFVIGSRDRYRTVYNSDAWFDKKWGKQLSIIRDNLGHEGRNEECKRLFDEIITTTLYSNHLQVTDSAHDGKDICSLCNLKKRCTKQVAGRLLASCCAQLAEAIIAFFGYIYECAHPDTLIVNWTQRYITADDKFTDILKAHKVKK